MMRKHFLRSWEVLQSEKPLEELTVLSLSRPVSRRSVVHQLTKFTFAIIGVSIASQILPYMAPTVVAGSEDDGLHGYPCGPGCSNAGLTQGNSWLQCMDIAKPGQDPKYRCCKYTDYCGTKPAGADSGCGQPLNLPPGQTEYPGWCKDGTGKFVCTEKSCRDVKNCKLYKVSVTDCACKQF